jgi:hypothetical protein
MTVSRSAPAGTAYGVPPAADDPRSPQTSSSNRRALT